MTTPATPSATRRVAIVGLGYVGLPVALAFARKVPGVIGFDVNQTRVADLRRGIDGTGESSAEELSTSSIAFTSELDDLATADFFVVAVPTPVDENHMPDLGPLRSATEMLAQILKKGDVIVYESTVYPGVTEEVCGPLLEEKTGLRAGVDFKLGYSPERINPGDREHTLETVVKVVAGQDPETLALVASMYELIVTAGVHRATSIKVAEAAKVIENTQRDLNIALMNELALVFDRIGIRTKDVLDAAGTKWNFLRFSPGLVGGHCIGVDPYYLTTKAEQLGYHPEVILAGRRINDTMGTFVAGRTIKMLVASASAVAEARVGVLGLTFKENVPDLRNSRVPDIIRELREFGVVPVVHDPRADPAEAKALYGVELCAWDQLSELDGVILAVPHDEYRAMGIADLLAAVKPGGIVVDVRSLLDPEQIPDGYRYWSL